MTLNFVTILILHTFFTLDGISFEKLFSQYFITKQDFFNIENQSLMFLPLKVFDICEKNNLLDDKLVLFKFDMILFA